MARHALHGPVRSSSVAAIESSPSPCIHSAWLLMTHVVVPNAKTRVSSAAVPGSLRRRSSR